MLRSRIPLTIKNIVSQLPLSAPEDGACDLILKGVSSPWILLTRGSWELHDHGRSCVDTQRRDSWKNHINQIDYNLWFRQDLGCCLLGNLVMPIVPHALIENKANQPCKNKVLIKTPTPWEGWAWMGQTFYSLTDCSEHHFCQLSTVTLAVSWREAGHKFWPFFIIYTRKKGPMVGKPYWPTATHSHLILSL